MKAFWEQPGTTAQDVIAALSSTKPEWTAATIKTLIGRLLRKGALRHEQEGKAYRYFPLYSEQECQRMESRSFLDRIFGGAISPMLAHFVESKPLNDEELAELEAIIRARRAKKK